MDTSAVKELIVTHSKGSDRAVGKLEVCALTLIHFFRSKVAATIVVVIALAFGVVSAADLDVLLQYLTSTGEAAIEASE